MFEPHNLKQTLDAILGTYPTLDGDFEIQSTGSVLSTRSSITSCSISGTEDGFSGTIHDEDSHFCGTSRDCDGSILKSFLNEYKSKKKITYEEFERSLRALNDKWECEMTETIQQSQQLIYEQAYLKESLKTEEAKKQEFDSRNPSKQRDDIVHRHRHKRAGPFQKACDELRHGMKEAIMKQKFREEIIATQLDLLATLERKISEKHEADMRAVREYNPAEKEFLNFLKDVQTGNQGDCKMEYPFHEDFDELRRRLQVEVDKNQFFEVDMKKETKNLITQNQSLIDERKSIESEFLLILNDIFEYVLNGNQTREINWETKCFSQEMMTKLAYIANDIKKKYNDKQKKSAEANTSVLTTTIDNNCSESDISCKIDMETRRKTAWHQNLGKKRKDNKPTQDSLFHRILCRVCDKNV